MGGGTEATHNSCLMDFTSETSTVTPSEELMKNCVEAWGEGDLVPVRKALHDDVVWISAKTEWDDRLCSGGVHRGRANVLALFAKIATGYLTTFCRAKEIVSSSEIVWGLFEFRAKRIGNGDKADRTVTIEMVFRWRIRDGKIVEAQTFFDTAALLGQQGKVGVA